MNLQYILILFILAIIPNCNARTILLYTADDNDSVMTGDILQSCLIDGFIKAVNEYPAKDRSSEIYIEVDNSLLTESSTMKIEQELGRKVIPVSLIARESNPKEISDKALIRGQRIWQILTFLEKNELIIEAIPWIIEIKNKRKQDFTTIFSDWYLSKYEYDCITDSWSFKSLELGGI